MFPAEVLNAQHTYSLSGSPVTSAKKTESVGGAWLNHTRKPLPKAIYYVTLLLPFHPALMCFFFF